MFDLTGSRAAGPLEGTGLQGAASWALEALSVARIVFYSIDCSTGFMLMAIHSPSAI